MDNEKALIEENERLRKLVRSFLAIELPGYCYYEDEHYNRCEAGEPQCPWCAARAALAAVTQWDGDAPPHAGGLP